MRGICVLDPVEICRLLTRSHRSSKGTVEVKSIRVLLSLNIFLSDIFEIQGMIHIIGAIDASKVLYLSDWGKRVNSSSLAIYPFYTILHLTDKLLIDEKWQQFSLSEKLQMMGTSYLSKFEIQEMQ